MARCRFFTGRTQGAGGVALGLLISGILLYGTHGCSRGPKTREQAFLRLSQAVRSHDAVALFAALDQDTRWAWMTVQRCHREAYDIVLSNFPAGADRDAKLRRFESGATAESAAALFARAAGEAALRTLTGRIPETATFEAPASGTGAPAAVAVPEARVASRSGDPLTFRFADGRWGYAGFTTEAADQAQRATADLEMIKISATDYERAAARGTL